MTFDRLRDFAGREDEIAAFETLVRGDTEAVALLVDGFSGTGKSTLADWLRAKRCRDLPSALVRLQPALALDLVLTEIVSSLVPDGLDGFEVALRAILAPDQLVNFTYAPKQSIDAKLKGEVRDASQSIGDLHLHLEQTSQAREDERTQRILRAFADALGPLRGKLWVLFFDESEHLEEPALRRLVLGQLVAQVHRRFPQARFVFTGQSVPVNNFEPHEQIHKTLEVFDQPTAERMMLNVGVKDAGIRARAYKLTGGHPLLLSMWVQAGPVDGARVGDSQSARTRWIYQRVIDRLSSPLSKKVAPDLALFEWFDLELLRRVFHVDLSEEEFRELAERAFVKPLSGGRWTCHDIVRLHLPPERRQIDPQSFEAKHLAVVAELRERLAGKPAYFVGRLQYVTAILHSLQAVRPADAALTTRRELAAAFVRRRLDAAYSIERHVRQAKFEPWGPLLAERISSALLRATSESPALDYASFLVDLAEATEVVSEADLLYFRAADTAWEAGDLAAAEQYAREALTLNQDAENFSIYAQILHLHGRQAEARQCLVEGRKQLGDLQQFALVEVFMLDRSGETDLALRRLTETVATFPQSREPRRALAWRLLADQKLEAASAQLVALQALGPADAETDQLELSILMASGRTSEALRLLRAKGITYDAGATDTFQTAVSAFEDPVELAKAESQLLSGDDTMWPMEVRALITAVAKTGDLERLDRVADISIALLPELADEATVQRALARILGGRVAEAVVILEGAVRLESSHPEAAVLLLKALGMLGDVDRQHEVLKLVAPPLRDMGIGIAAQALASTLGPSAGLAFIDEEAANDGIVPMTLFARAALLQLADKDDTAIETLETLVNTYTLSQVPRFVLLSAYSMLGQLLARQRHVEQARQVGSNLFSAFGRGTAVVNAVAGIYMVLGDVAALRDLRKDVPKSSPLYSALVAATAQALLSSKRTIEDMLEELRQYPDRMELAAAIDSRASQLDPGDVPALLEQMEDASPGVVLALTELSRGMIKQVGAAGIDGVRHKIQLEPHNGMLRAALIRLLLHGDRLTEAMAELPGLQPDAPAGLFNLIRSEIANALIGADQLAEAEALLADVLAADRPNPMLANSAMTLLYEKGDLDTLIELVKRRLNNPDEAREIVLMNAASLFVEAAPTLSNDMIEELRSMEVTSVVALDAIGTLRQLGRYQDAIDWLREIEPLPTSAETAAEIHDELGRCYRGLDQHALAVSEFQKAIVHNPRRAWHYTALSDSLAHQNRLQEAYEALQTAVTLEPDLFAPNEGRLRELHAALLAAEPPPSNTAGAGALEPAPVAATTAPAE